MRWLILGAAALALAIGFGFWEAARVRHMPRVVYGSASAPDAAAAPPRGAWIEPPRSMPADPMRCSATAWADGDTLTVMCGGAQHRIRVRSVDTVERGEPGMQRLERNCDAARRAARSCWSRTIAPMIALSPM
jgi:endonuclease YncB( thermonuclease family)